MDDRRYIWDLVVIAGPDAGRRVPLQAGVTIIGRGDCRDRDRHRERDPVEIALDDPELEVHHLLTEVSVDGVTLTQLAGRVPLRVGGEPAGRTVSVDGDVVLELGGSLLRFDIHRPPAPGPAPGPLVRSPRQVRPLPDATVVVPDVPTSARSPISAVSLIAAGVTALGAVLIAVVVGQPMLALFGLLGALGAGATWLVGKIAASRSNRRARRRRARAHVEFRRALELAGAALRADHLARAAPPAPASPWARRSGDADGFLVTLGVGVVRRAPIVTSTGSRVLSIGEVPPELQPDVDASACHPGLPVLADLGRSPSEAIALAGEGAMGVARSIVTQLAHQLGPADWRLSAVMTTTAEDAWLGRLPQLAADPSRVGRAVISASDARQIALRLARFDDGDRRRLVVLTDVPALLTVRTGPLRRLIDALDAITVLVLVPGDTPIPAACSAVLHMRQRWRGSWSPELAVVTAAADRLHLAGCSSATAKRRADALSDLIDPEDPTLARDVIPASIGLADIGAVPVSATVLADSWRALDASPAPVARLGATCDGWLDLDLDRDGPHALIAGTTGSGKSELLRTLVLALAIGQPPTTLTFVLVDYKGGATFDALSRLPHTVGLVTDLDGSLAERALASLDAEIRRRERLLREASAADLGAYRRCSAEPLPRLVVVVDEFAALAGEIPDFLTSLIDVARRGRSLGVHLVLATQRPAGVVSDDIRANTNLRIALRLPDASDAIDVVGDVSPSRLPRGLPGRAVVRLGPGELVEFQTATVSSATGDLDRIVAHCSEAADLVGAPASHRPWLPALPEAVGWAERRPGAMGIIDRPDQQSRVPLVWRPTDRHLAIIGSASARLASSLLTVAATTVEHDQRTHLYAIDATGSGALRPLLRLANCGAVVGLHEHERLDRLLRHLGDELRSRKATGVGACRAVVCVIDGLAALRTALDSPEREATGAELDELLNDAGTTGVVVIAGIEGSRGVSSVVNRFAHRWIGHLDDPTDGPTFGVATVRVPPAIPGRVVDAASGHVAQIAHLVNDDLAGVLEAIGRDTPFVADAAQPSPISTLPAVVDASRLPPTGISTRSGTELVVGLDAAALTPAVFDVPIGDHVMVIGPTRSGRSNALAVLVAARAHADPGEVTTVLCGSARSPLSVHPSAVDSEADVPSVSGSHLLLVDDAERVTDPNGVLAARIESGELTVFASGRAESLRALFGHWTAIVRRSRLGLVMAASGELDGDLLSNVLPRRMPIPARPGLAWLIDPGGHRLIQLTVDSTLDAHPSPATGRSSV